MESSFEQMFLKRSENIEIYLQTWLIHSLKSNLEAVVQRCSVKKVFLEISQNSQENTCARASFLIKLWACNFIKKEALTITC